MKIRYFMRLFIFCIIGYYNEYVKNVIWEEENSCDGIELNTENINSINSYGDYETELDLSSTTVERYEVEKVIVRGFLGWNDPNQVTHPAQNFKVRIWNEGLLYNKLIDSTITDEEGNYEFEIYQYTGIKMYIELYPETEHVVIENKNNFLTKIEITKDNIINDVLSFVTVLGNNDIMQEAYSTVQALEYASKYVNAMTGQYLPQVEVDYPAKVSVGTCYNMSSKKINIISSDAYDWDVIMHEYGHYVADSFSFINEIGGNHNHDDILTDVLNNKLDGISLAWNEGWATYFSLSSQKYFKLNELGIANTELRNVIGDNVYNDTIDNWAFDNVKARRMGEANEHTIAGFLLCLADVDEETNFDNFSYGYEDIWSLIVDNRLTCLSDFCQHLYAAHSFDFCEIGGLLSHFGIAVELSRYTSDSYNFGNYMFSWIVPNRDSEYCLNKYVLKFYDKYKQNYYAVDNLSTSYYEPSLDEWEIILSRTKGPFYWAVESFATKDYMTGPYVSEFKKVDKPDAYELNQYYYGFEPQYYFYEKSREIIVDDLAINTRRLRTGYIENEYIVLSPKRENAGMAYLEYDFNKSVYAIGVDLAFWSGIEAINKNNGTCYLQYKNKNGEWVVCADFLNDYKISTNRKTPTHLCFVFVEKVNEIRFITTAYPEGDRNKGRLCIGRINFYV